MMPGLDGETAFRHLRDDPSTVDLPVIFVTAKAQRHQIDRYLESGVLGVIAKPFDPMTLAERVETLWRSRC